ncbi:MAG: hypothetical protein E7018_02760 [Alphaproteobacteria bacterium]|nr:hypothetical protein [Alphaproteobacteria bacterium]
MLTLKIIGLCLAGLSVIVFIAFIIAWACMQEKQFEEINKQIETIKKKLTLYTMDKKDKAPQVKDYLCGAKVVKSKPQKITGVIPIEDDGYEILTYDSHAFLQSHTDTTPRYGDIIVFYTIREKKVVGIELNGELLYFLSEEDI